jgi:hypothetical protein
MLLFCPNKSVAAFPYISVLLVLGISEEFMSINDQFTFKRDLCFHYHKQQWTNVYEFAMFQIKSGISVGPKDIKPKALDLYSGGARFESRPEHRPSWLRLSCFSSVPPNKCWDITSIRPRLLPSRSASVPICLPQISYELKWIDPGSLVS